MVCWACSGLSQKAGRSIWAASWSRRLVLAARSKRVPQLCETADHLIGTATEVGIHRRVLLLNGWEDVRSIHSPCKSSITEKRFAYHTSPRRAAAAAGEAGSDLGGAWPPRY